MSLVANLERCSKDSHKYICHCAHRSLVHAIGRLKDAFAQAMDAFQRELREAMCYATGGVQKSFRDGRVIVDCEFGCIIPGDGSRQDVSAKPDIFSAAIGSTEGP